MARLEDFAQNLAVTAAVALGVLVAQLVLFALVVPVFVFSVAADTAQWIWRLWG